MGRASVAAAGFALSGGAAADPAGVVHVARTPDRFGRVLLACVEPLDYSPRGRELAAIALRTICKTFAATPGPATDALLGAFAAANVAVMAENRPLVTGRWGRRICVGATGVAIAGREIIVAQAAPTQALLVQDGQVYAFPDVASWRGDYAPDAPTPESHPLGFSEEITPRLFASEAATGDLIALCATSVGRALGRDEAALIDLYGGSLLTDDLEGSVDRLERLLADHDIIDAFAVIASLSRLPGGSRFRQRLAGGRRQTAGAAFAGGLAVPGPAEVQPPSLALSNAPVRTPVIDERPPLFEGVRDWAIDLAELLSARRRKPVTPYETRQRALAAPGALSVQRYRESSGLPPEWRANLPRGPGLVVPARLLAVSLVLFLALGGTGIAVGRQRDREARAQTALAAADVALQNALDNSGTAMSFVAEAESAIATAREAGAAEDALDQREEALASVRDTIWDVRRLEDVVRIGALPGGAGTGTVRVALSGRTLYLAAGDLYELDAEAGVLLALLSRGNTVDGEVVGDLRFVSFTDSTVVASDGAATYARDEKGRWQRRPLAIDQVGGLRAGAPIISWGEASYSVSWSGDIVRFDQSTGGPLADVWAAAEDTPDLETLRDLAIDGRIHALLQDGRTLVFSRGALTGTVAPFVVPTMQDAAFLAEAPFATAYYIVDRSAVVGENTGRIVHVDATGDAWQYLVPAPEEADPEGQAAAVSLASAQDLAVDELSGTVYWVSDGEIWRASLPPNQGS